MPNYIKYIDSARLASDKVSVKTLNDATVLFANDREKLNTEVFSGISSDSSKMDLLLDGGYIGAIPTPKQKNTSFVFSQSNGLWTFSNLLFFTDFSIASRRNGNRNTQR